MPEQRRVVRTVRAYFAALNAMDGARLCSLLVPGALRSLPLPPGPCERSLERSLGRPSPEGFPPWTEARLKRVRSVTVPGARARVTVAVVHAFEGGDPLPVEDDVIHLVRRRGRWQVAKPSVSLHRAVGRGEIPPEVLAAP